MCHSGLVVARERFSPKPGLRCSQCNFRKPPRGGQPIGLSNIVAVTLFGAAAWTAWKYRDVKPWRTPLDRRLLALLTVICFLGTLAASLRLGALSRYAVLNKTPGSPTSSSPMRSWLPFTLPVGSATLPARSFFPVL